MSGLRSRNKGKSGERELAIKLSALLGVQCRRGQQFSGLEGRDVVGVDGLHIECKRTEKLNLYNAINQAVRDARNDDLPVVCHRRSRADWLCVLRLADITRFARVIQQIEPSAKPANEEDELCQEQD